MDTLLPPPNGSPADLRVSRPASPSELRFWLIAQRGFGQYFHNCPLGVEIDGELNLSALAAAASKVTARHGLLRAGFIERHGTVECVIATSSECQAPLQVIDLRTAGDDCVRQRDDYIARTIQTAFDLRLAPLWRMVVFLLPSHRSYIHVCFHHIISDSFSFDIFLKEIAECYSALCEGRDPILLPPLPQIVTNPPIEPAVQEAARQYWRSCLADAPTAPIGMNGGSYSNAPHQGGIVVRLFDHSRMQRLRSAAARYEATLYHVLLSGCMSLVSCVTGQSDVVVGTMVSGRRDNTRRAAIGCFVNTVALRVNVKADLHVRDLVMKCREVSIGAIEHQAYPFQEVVAEHGTEFSVLFAYQQGYRDPNGWFGALPGKVVFEEGLQGSCEFDLFIQIFDRGPTHRVTFQYRRDSFHHATVERLMDTFMRVLDAIADDGELPVNELPTVSQDDERWLLRMGEGTQTVLPSDITVLDLIQDTARARPRAVAVVDGDCNTTYEILLCRSHALAKRIIAHGVNSQDKVALLIERSSDLILAIIGVLQAGCAYVPLDPEHPAERQRFILADSSARLIVASKRWETMARDLADATIILGDDAPVDVIKVRQPQGIRTMPDHLAYVIYTSGSTGLPKGVQVEHRSLLNLVQWGSQTFMPEELSGTLCASSATFDSSVFEIFTPLCAGGTIVIAPNLLEVPMLPYRDSIRLFITGAPSALMELLKHRALPGNVSCVILAGERVSKLLIDMIAATGHVRRIYNLYGPTEATVYSTAHLVDPTLENDPPIGRPIDNVTTYVLDATRRLSPLGCQGELFIGGFGLARGYSAPALTEERFTRNPFGKGMLYATGDLVRYDGDGNLHYVGRIDNQVKIRGRRIEIEEIESVLKRHKEVTLCAVVRRTLDMGSDCLVAYVESASLGTCTAAALRQHLSRHLPDYMIPSHFVMVESIPLNQNGKIDRNRLPAYCPKVRREPDPARVNLESSVIQCWSEVLEVEAVGPTDRFFDAGGNSLLLLRLQRSLANKFEVELTISELFENPTPHSQAVVIGQRRQIKTDIHVLSEGATSEPSQTAVRALAVVGTACRLPMAGNPEEFWELQLKGLDCITSVPAERRLCWAHQQNRGIKLPLQGGFLPDVDLFDPQSFGMSPREARLLDPQQRVLLELTKELLERAAVTPSELRAARVGVFVGASLQDYQLLLSSEGQFMQPYVSSGTALSMLSNRISYTFGLRGPSLTVDTACSSSLYALHLARQSLLEGECDVAIVAGVALLLSGDTVAGWEASGMLAADGRCRSFDRDASGYGVSEGAVCLLLKRYSDIDLAREPVLALLRGTAVNHDGCDKMGLTVPSSAAQAQVIRDALASAEVGARSISYIEAHGSGTPLGDPLEFKGLVDAFVSHTNATKFCGLGCIKSNIGHTGPAAGLAGVLKVILALQHAQLPGLMHLRTPNPDLLLAGSPFYLCERLQPWTASLGSPRRAGVSAFGFGGANAHAVLEEAPSAPIRHAPSQQETAILTLSSRSRSLLLSTAASYLSFLDRTPDVALHDLCCTANHSRPPMKYRLAIVAVDLAELTTRLRAVVGTDLDPPIDRYVHVGESGSSVDAAVVASLQQVLQALTDAERKLVRSVAHGDVAEQCFSSPAMSEDVALFDAKNTRSLAMLAVIAKLFSLGALIDWNGLDESIVWRRILLPTSSLERQHLWFKSSNGLPHETRPQVDKTADSVPLWSPIWRVANQPIISEDAGAQTYLLLGSDSELSDRLAHRLVAHGSRVVVAGPKTRVIPGVRTFTCDLDDSVSLSGALEEVMECAPGPVNVVSLSALEHGPFSLIPRPLALNLENMLRCTVGLIGAVARARERPMILRLITTGSQAVLSNNDVTDPSSAMIWGYAAALHCGYPHLSIQCCDLDSRDGIDAWIDSIANECLAAPHECGVAFRNGQRFLPDVTLAASPHIQHSGIRRGGRYLLTGGEGGIGQQLAHWLGDEHEAQTLLVSRHPHDACKSHPLSKSMTGDIADEDTAVAAVGQALSILGGLDGVFHLAGVSGEKKLVDETPDSAFDVFWPKAVGLACLDRAVADLNLDFLAVFSSLAGFVGSSMLGSYCAANRFVSSLAAWSAAHGGPIVDIGWCGWRGIGMATRLRPEFVSHQYVIDPSEALRTIPTALAIAMPSILVSPIRPQFPVNIPGQQPDGAHAETASEVIQVMKRTILTVLGECLQMDASRIDEGTSFIEMGVDSITTVAMLERIEAIAKVHLPSNVFLEYPTIDELAAHMASSVVCRQTEFGPANVNATTRHAGSTQVINLNHGRSDTGSEAMVPIAVVGIAGRFPKAPDIETFWRNLLAAVDCTSLTQPQDVEGHATRVHRFGFLESIDAFDAAVFRIAPSEARRMDPQQRQLLEVVHEALEDAGWLSDDERLRTGVFVGASASPFPDTPTGPLHPDSLIAASVAILANRVSYSFDLRGPSLVIDTLCSSSLVAVHYAVESLQRHECDVAIVAGVRIGISERYIEGAVASGAISPSGICRSFDARADGMVPGEGVGAIVLRRLDDELRGGTLVRFVIRGTAVGHTGRGSGLVAPQAKAQAATVAQALHRAGLCGRDISYVEAHGTGTRLGDPIELEGLRQAFGDLPPASCPIGSLKPNIGHLEPASGIAGIIKVGCAMNAEVLAPTLHYEIPNPEVPWNASPFFVVSSQIPWRAAGNKPRRAGVSSFGIGGVNAHVILEEARGPEPRPSDAADERMHILPLSAQTNDTLLLLGSRTAAYLRNTNDPLKEICRTAGSGRRHFRERLCVVEGDRTAMANALQRFSDNQHSEAIFSGQGRSRRPTVGFVYAGQGAGSISQHQCLYELEPIFKKAVDHCAAHLRSRSQIDLQELLFQDKGLMSDCCRPDIVQPALFTIQYAMTQLLISWGIRPDFVIGHSFGEYLAACTAGTLSLGDALNLAADSGKIMHRLGGGGAMYVLGTDRNRIEEAIKSAGGLVAVAAHNADDLFVIAGRQDSVTEVALVLKEHCHIWEQLSVDVGYHSYHVEPVLGEIERLAAAVQFQQPKIPWISTLTGSRVSRLLLTSGQYWRRQAREPVMFAQALRAALREGCDLFVDLGVTAANASMGAHILEDPTRWCTGVSSSEEPYNDLYRTIARLYVFGIDISWSHVNLGRARERVGLPTYPFARNVLTRDGATTHHRWAMKQSNKVVSDKLIAEIQALVRQFLELPDQVIDVDLPLVELGANSLSIAGLAECLSHRYDVRMQLRDFFDQFSTVSSIAAHVEESSRGNENMSVGDPAVRSASGHTILPAFEQSRTIESHRPVDPTFVAAYTAKTKTSRVIAQRSRTVLADSRGIAGFRPSLKDMQYPIVAERAAGSHIWDVDGNEYIDIAMGFGVQLFGHSAPPLVSAIERSLSNGLLLGPQSGLAEGVARRICSVTATERCVFTNSGSEAVMLAVRLARAFTGRKLIAVFEGSYHGFYDGTLAVAGGEGYGRPGSSGVPNSVANDVLVLPYGELESIRVLKAHAHELAAVIVEPVQSRRPQLQPREFLVELRNLTRRAGIVLVFDEVILGFRVHPGGAQAVFGIRADLVLFGKILGGGLPIGVVAGRSDVLDLVDGGYWRYQDDSMPSSDRVFFASTFAKNPLVLALADAVLEIVESRGRQLQDELSERTEDLVRRVNEVCTARACPIRAHNFTSLFTFTVPPNLELFYYALIKSGVYVWEGRTCFLSTSHTDNDIDGIVTACERAIDDLRATQREVSAGDVSLALAPSLNSPSLPEIVAPTCLQRDLLPLITRSSVVSSAYNEAVLLDIQGEFNIDQFREAFCLIVERHESLRTCVSQDSVMLTLCATTAPQVELHPLPDNLSRIGELISIEAARPFDLAVAPLVRAHAWCLSTSRTLLLLVGQHLVIDADGFMTLLSELEAAYESKQDSRVLQLPPPSSYRAIASDWPESPDAATVDFWRSRFSDGIQLLELPVDYSFDSQVSGAGGHVIVDLELTRTDVSRLAVASHATPFAILLASFHAWLARITGTDDITIVVPYSWYPRGAPVAVIGQFVTLVPVRTRLSCSQSFAELISAVRTALFDSLEHGRCSVSALANILGFRGQDFPFQIEFNMEFQADRTSFAGLSTQAIDMRSPMIPLDLSDIGGPLVDFSMPTVKKHLALSIRLVGERYWACLEGSTDLFAPATLAALGDSLGAFTRAAITSSDTPVSVLPLMHEKERRRLTVDLNNTFSDLTGYDHFTTMLDAISDQAAGQTIVKSNKERLTLADLKQRANMVAAKLNAAGIAEGAIVALYGARSPDYLAAMIATLQIGAAFMALDLRDPWHRITRIILRSGAAAIILIGTKDYEVDELRELLSKTTVKIISSSGLPQLSPAPLLQVRPSGHALAYVTFTSGSTGEPKGVMVEHRGLCNHIMAKIRSLGLGSSDIVAQTALTAFDVFIWQMLAPLCASATLVIIPEEEAADPEALCAAIRAAGVTVLEIVPSLLRELVGEATKDRRIRDSLMSLRWLIATGETLPPDLANRWHALFPKIPIVNAYGPAECTDNVAQAVIRGPVDMSVRAVPIGLPLQNTRLFVLDQQQQLVPIGVTGELWVAGIGVGAGYVNDSEATSAVFRTDFTKSETNLSTTQEQSHRIFRTGDLVRRNASGSLEYLGRKDRQIKILGQRIELGEIESVLTRHSSVRTAVVDIVRHAQRPKLVAYVVPASDIAASTIKDNVAKTIWIGELRTYLAAEIPNHMIPQQFVVMSELPRTRSGKLDRSALPPVSEATNPPQAGDDHLTSVERSVMEVFAHVLGSSTVTATANFFEQGGDSLATMSLLHELHRTMHRRISLRAFMKAPTVRGVAALIRGHSTNDAVEPIVLEHGVTGARSLFVVHAADGALMAYTTLVRAIGSQHPIYGFECHEWRDVSHEQWTIEMLARRYVDGVLAQVPTIPINLAGWSMGGLVAYEMAQQLLDAGYDIGRLVIIDSEMPDPSADNTLVGEAEIIRLFCAGLGVRLDRIMAEEIQLKPPDKRNEYILKSLSGSLGFLSTEVLEQRFCLFRENVHAMWAYKPRSYSGNLTVIASTDTARLRGPSLGWHAVAVSLACHMVDGDHFSIMKDSSIEAVADVLRAGLLS